MLPTFTTGSNLIWQWVQSVMFLHNYARATLEQVDRNVTFVDEPVIDHCGGSVDLTVREPLPALGSPELEGAPGWAAPAPDKLHVTHIVPACEPCPCLFLEACVT